MALRGRRLLSGISWVCVGLLAGCSTSSSGQAPPQAVPGPTESGCQVQGYFDEGAGGQCPAGTCVVFAFDTNGAPLPCCTSIVSGPGTCIDGGAMASPDAAVTASDAALQAESAAADGGPGDAVAEGSSDASESLEAGGDALADGPGD